MNYIIHASRLVGLKCFISLVSLVCNVFTRYVRCISLHQLKWLHYILIIIFSPIVIVVTLASEEDVETELLSSSELYLVLKAGELNSTSGSKHKGSLYFRGKSNYYILITIFSPILNVVILASKGEDGETEILSTSSLDLVLKAGEFNRTSGSRHNGALYFGGNPNISQHRPPFPFSKPVEGEMADVALPGCR